MYLYFDRNGVLKEFINDKQARQINTNVNKIYCYYEDDNEDISMMTIKFRYSNGSVYPSSGFALSTTTTTKEIEYDKARDLKYFKYFTNYKFYVYSIPNDVLAQGGAVECALALADSEEVIQGLEKFTFYIADSLVSEDSLVTYSQYTYLMLKIAELGANNPTITITQGGVTKGSFTLNQEENETIALDGASSGTTLYRHLLYDTSSVNLDKLEIITDQATAFEYNIMYGGYVLAQGKSILGAKFYDSTAGKVSTALISEQYGHGYGVFYISYVHYFNGTTTPKIATLPSSYTDSVTEL